MTVLYYLLILYLIVVLVRVFSTWFPVPYSGPLRRILDVCSALTDPILNPLRRAVPPVRTGAIALDLSPMILTIVLGILISVVGSKT